MISKLSLRDVYIVWSFQFTVNYLGKLVVVVRHITSVACRLLSLLLISYTWRAKLCSDSRMDFFFFSVADSDFGEHTSWTRSVIHDKQKGTW